MIIKPRKIESGFLKRWSGQALELLLREFHLWFGLAIMFSLVGWCANKLIPGLALLFVGAFMGISSEIALISDEQKIRFVDLPLIVANATRQFFIEIWAQRILVTTTVVLGIALLVTGPDSDMLRLTAPAATRIDYTSPVVWIFSDYSPFMLSAWALLVVACLYGYTRPRLTSFRYPLRRVLGLTDDAAEMLCEQAGSVNPLVMLGFILSTTGLLLIPVVVPILLPFVLCFAPAFNYVAFREIFVDDKGNQKQSVKQSATVAAAVPG